MSRSAATVIGNNFSKGLITEATGINFPDNAVTEELNVVFEHTGKVTRRLGIDIESSAKATGYSDNAGVVKEYVWQAVSNSGGWTFLVLQIGTTINFYELNVAESLSGNVLPSTVDLDDYKAAGGSDLKDVPCNFTSGSGYLFVSHPYCSPIVVKYDSTEDKFYASPINIFIRDFEGVSDGLAVGENPTTLSDEHHYNLRNQGWNQNVRIGHNTNELSGDIYNGDTNVDPNFGWVAL